MCCALEWGLLSLCFLGGRGPVRTEVLTALLAGPQGEPELECRGSMVRKRGVGRWRGPSSLSKGVSVCRHSPPSPPVLFPFYREGAENRRGEVPAPATRPRSCTAAKSGARAAKLCCSSVLLAPKSQIPRADFNTALKNTAAVFTNIISCITWY